MERVLAGRLGQRFEQPSRTQVRHAKQNRNKRTIQHLVDAEDVEGVDTDTEMERVLAGGLGHVLVGANTGGLESLGRQLLVLVRDERRAEGEVIDAGTLAPQIEDTDLRNVGEDSGDEDDASVSEGRAMWRRNSRKITFGSGTPRLYLDLGYGLFLQ